MTTDEFLCLCDGDRKIWCAEDCCTLGKDPYAVLENDGNLRAYGQRIVPIGTKKLWRTDIADETDGPTKLKIFNSGDLAIIDDKSDFLWTANTNSWSYLESSGKRANYDDDLVIVMEERANYDDDDN